MELNNGLKNVNSGLIQKTESTIAATDLIQLYGADGTPNGKISKADLMDCVKDALPALLADQTTTGVKFPSINSSNVLGSMTAANLASVLDTQQIKMLGGGKAVKIVSAQTVWERKGVAIAYMRDNIAGTIIVSTTKTSSDYKTAIFGVGNDNFTGVINNVLKFYRDGESSIWIYSDVGSDTSCRLSFLNSSPLSEAVAIDTTSMTQLTADVLPGYLSSYQTLPSLATALGVQGGFRSHYQPIDNNATVEYTYTHGIFISTAGSSRYAIGRYNSESPVLFSGLSANYSTTKDNANTINIYKENSKLVFQNKTGSIQYFTVAFFTPTT